MFYKSISDKMKCSKLKNVFLKVFDVNNQEEMNDYYIYISSNNRYLTSKVPLIIVFNHV